MHNTLKTAAIVLALTASASHGEELAPDALVKTISLDVLAAIQKDKDLKGGNPKKIASLVEAKILPHFDFAHTTRIAMGANWRRASPEQREQLVREFRTLLVRTYSGVLVNYRDQVIEFKPLRAQPGDAPNPTERREQDYEVRKPLFGCCFGIVNCSRYPTALRLRARQFATSCRHAAAGSRGRNGAAAIGAGDLRIRRPDGGLARGRGARARDGHRPETQLSRRRAGRAGTVDVHHRSRAL